MSSASTPLRKGPSGPKAPVVAGVGAIIRVGFDRTAGDSNYAGMLGALQIQRAPGVPLQIPMTGFTPGNSIIITWRLSFFNNSTDDASPMSFQMFPAIDIGAGFQAVSSELQSDAPTTSDTIFLFLNDAGVAHIRPDPDALVGDPVVSLYVLPQADATIGLDAGAGWLVALEVAADAVIQESTATLGPLPGPPC